jgi:hypothetical protein
MVSAGGKTSAVIEEDENSSLEQHRARQNTQDSATSRGPTRSIMSKALIHALSAPKGAEETVSDAAAESADTNHSAPMLKDFDEIEKSLADMFAPLENMDDQ